MSKVSAKKIRQVKDLYFQDGRMPIKIYRMTGIPIETVREILGGECAVKSAPTKSNRNDSR